MFVWWAAGLGNEQIILGWYEKWIYRKISNIRRNKSQNLKDPRLVLQLSFPNSLKPGVKSRMKI